MKIERISKGTDLLKVKQDQSVRVIVMQVIATHSIPKPVHNFVLRVLSLSPLKREKPGNEVA